VPQQVFVAAAAKKEQFTFQSGIEFASFSAAAAVSETGIEWETVALPGAMPAGLDQFSWGLAVVFVKSSGGYFLMSDHEYIGGDRGDAVPQSNLYRSEDGYSWVKLRANNNWMSTLSVIAMNLDPATIVHK
jgi:hypothetical protein